MIQYVLFISGSEIVIIALVALLLFGSKKLPEMARGLAKGMKEFRKAADDIKRELNDSAPEITKDLKDVSKGLKDSTEDMVKDFRKFKNDIE